MDKKELVVAVDNVEAFENTLKTSPQPVVAHFWASWAVACQKMEKIFSEIAAKYPSAKFYTVNIQ